MNTAYYKNRWKENSHAKLALKKIIHLINKGGTLKQDYSSFELTDDGYADFRGIDFSHHKIKQMKLNMTDLSFSNFQNTWIEKSVFTSVKFEKTDFSKIADHGNVFRDVDFLDCKFQRAVLGYKGSIYMNCTFKYCNFIKSGFIRGEFSGCQFLDCKFNGVDFNASSFENCHFAGKLVDIWFRGNYGCSFGEREFGKAKKNLMKNVSFEEAVLEGLTFSNNCDLSTIKLPRTGNYVRYDNWLNKLERLKRESINWPITQKKEAEIFINSHLIHADTQNWYILNVDEIKKDYGANSADAIIKELNQNG